MTGPPFPASPLQIKNYTVVRKLASGGMAEVYLAAQEGPGGFRRAAVLKRIHPHLAEDPDFVDMLVQEAAMAAGLNHPNIVHIYELLYGESGEPFIAMEYVRGESIVAIVRESNRRGIRVPFWCVTHVGKKICEALDYAYNAHGEDGRPLHVIHRDVSPANVILSMDGQVKLVDFGIAKAVDVGGTTRAGTVKGKYAYMSPEQLRGDDLDKRSDIFSLGVVLYEMITRQRLFRGQNEAAIAKALLHDTIPGLVARAPGQVPTLPEDVVDSMHAAECPPALEQIIMKCLARDREGRYQSAGALHDALDDFSRSERYEVTTAKLVEYMRYVFPARVEPELALTPPPPRTSAPPPGGLSRSSAPPVTGVTPKGASSGAASQRPGAVPSTPPPARQSNPPAGPGSVPPFRARSEAPTVLEPSELAPPAADAPPQHDRSTPYMVIGLLLLSAAFWFFVYPNL